MLRRRPPAIVVANPVPFPNVRRISKLLSEAPPSPAFTVWPSRAIDSDETPGMPIGLESRIEQSNEAVVTPSLE
jgi:hypothetical protein